MTGTRETSLRRGIALLEALGGEESQRAGGLRVTDLVGLVGWDKSQVSRTLRTLADCGLVERDGRALRYRLTWRLHLLSAGAGDHRLLEQAAPLLRNLVSELGERAHLSVLQGHEVLTLLSLAGNHAIQAAGWTGRTVPCWCTSSGRALLFDHDRNALTAMLRDVELQPRGPDAPADVAELYQRVASARERGVAVVSDELEAGLTGVAAPVRDFRGQLVGVVNVSGPSFRLGQRMSQAIDAVRRAAGKLSTALGHSPSGASAAG